MNIQLIDTEHIACAAQVIRESFRTVADEFGLTPENCPTHPSFMTEERLRAQLEGGLQLFGCYAGNALAGVIGITKTNSCEFEIERLSVLPEYRHRRYGAKLMTFACEQIRREGGEKACISVIDENTMLKEWYQQQGFLVIEIKRFPNLPFTVCFMGRAVNTITKS